MTALKTRNDQQLIEAIAAGDMNAVTEFYQRHEARVFRYASSKLSDSFAAADILNDVMIDVWRSAGRFQGRSKVSTWLLGIAHNKVMDHWRKKGGREFTEIDDSAVDDSPEVNPEAALAAASDGKLLRLCLAKLKDEHREILHLIFFEDLGYNEIAEIINVPEGTVKSRAFHARAMMKKQLAHAMSSP